MERNRVIQAVVLKQHRMGENHAGIQLLSQQDGLISAVAHGVFSRRGYLKGRVDPFTIGAFNLYTDPVKNRSKIQDVDIFFQPFHLRQNIEKMYTASLWGEIILKSHGGGEAFSDVFSLAKLFLQKLDTCSQEDVRLLSILFLLHWLHIVGSVDENAFEGMDVAIQSFIQGYTYDIHEISLDAYRLGVLHQRRLLGWCYRQTEKELGQSLNTLQTGLGIIV